MPVWIPNRRVRQSTAHRDGRTEPEEPQALGTATDVQIETLGVKMNLTLAGDQDGLGVRNQTLHDQRAVVNSEIRDRATDRDLAFIPGEQ